ncbi:hypothetical protein [Acetobacter vaccinii]|nr:hypothetical protein [Acetobacter vaccinii]
MSILQCSPGFGRLRLWSASPLPALYGQPVSGGVVMGAVDLRC